MRRALGLHLFIQIRKLRASRCLIRYAVAMSVSGAAIALTAALTEAIPSPPNVVLFAAVLTVAWVVGLGPAILAAVLCGLTALVYLREPLGNWSLNAHDAFWMMVFLTTVLAMASLTNRIRRVEDERAHLLVRERDARAQAEAANSAKDHFLAIVSHEMKTPLTAILAWLELLRRTDTQPAERARAIETMARNATLQSKLVDDLLDVSRAVAGGLGVTRTDMDISDSVRHVVMSGQLRAQNAGVKVVTDVEPGVRVLGDRQRLDQVVGNLLSNAIKFTPPGGLINVSVARASATARIVVADSGQGIEPGHLDKVFERFWQESTPRVGRREGLGLGLAIVKYIVDEHGGRVRAESVGHGHGTTFVVDLPLA